MSDVSVILKIVTATYACWNEKCSRYAEAGRRLDVDEVYADRTGRLHCKECNLFVRPAPRKEILTASSSVATAIAAAAGGLLGFAVGGPGGAAVGAGLGAWLADDDVAPLSRRVEAFISFAAEDAFARDLFVGQSKHPDTPWNIKDASLHEPFSSKWKTKTRPRITACDVLILLVGPTTHRANGALWEVNCATSEGVPTFGVWISTNNRGPVPPCIQSHEIIDWKWDEIGRLIRKASHLKSRS
jgi:hypothetical protein